MSRGPPLNSDLRPTMIGIETRQQRQHAALKLIHLRADIICQFARYIVGFCLRPDSEAVAEGLGRQFDPSLHFTEFLEKSSDK
jgi:hypothetical protein